MAGKKGMKGGGGARPGAGRKPKPPILSESLALMTSDPETFLVAAMNDPATDMRMRVDAAKALLAHKAKMETASGKKGARRSAAADVAGGKFAATAAPKLALVK